MRAYQPETPVLKLRFLEEQGMISKDSDRRQQGLLLVCPSCRSKCRARAGTAKAFRCPRCGTVLRPDASQSDADLGGQPAESARDRLAARPEPAENARGKQAAGPVEDAESEEGAYAAHAPVRVRPVEEPEPDEVENIEVRRKRPPAPRVPLWWGVYGFPWHPSALRAWFLFGIGLMLVALMGAGLHYVIDLYASGDMAGSIWLRVFILYMKAFVLFLL